jgi:RimJ/RimL family protein N-acetyltransferase
MKLKSNDSYWLAKPYWSKENMTAAVKKASEYAFKEFGLTKITAKNQPNQLLN